MQWECLYRKQSAYTQSDFTLRVNKTREQRVKHQCTKGLTTPLSGQPFLKVKVKVSCEFPQISQTCGSQQLPSMAAENQLNEILLLRLHIKNKLWPVTKR